MKQLLLLCCTLLCFNAFAQKRTPAPPPPPPQQQQQPDYKKVGAPVPPFRIMKTDSSFFFTRDLKAGKPLAIFIFSPTCDHCEKAIDSMMAHKDVFKNAQMVWVCEAVQWDHLPAFISRMHMKDNPMFHFIGIDKSNLIYYLYEYALLPQLTIYNSQGKLAHTFRTNMPIDSVRMFLR